MAQLDTYEIAPDPEEVWLSGLRDATLLVLGVVAHAHGATTTEIRHATGQWRPAVRLSLRHLSQKELVTHERRPGDGHWYSTAHGTRLGVTPYVVRLLDAARPFHPGDAHGGWSVQRFRAVGSEHGPPIFRPSFTLTGVDDPRELAAVVAGGTTEDRAYAMTKLLALRDPACVPLLIEIAQRRGDEELLARQATLALGSFATPAAVAPLIEIAGHRDSYMREAAARSLGRLEAHEAIPTLAGLVAYDSAPVRVAAIRALERIGDRSAVDAIAPALTDHDRTVRHTARHALIALGARPHRVARIRWRA